MESGYVAGVDVHKAMLAVVVGRSGQAEAQWQRRKFGTTTQELENLVAWLQHHQVQEVAMESTAQYWKPVWITLEAHRSTVRLVRSRPHPRDAQERRRFHRRVRLLCLFADSTKICCVTRF